MSERQARQKRKNASQVEEKQKKSSPLFGIIIAVVIIVFLGLGGYAVKDNIKAILPERPEKEATVADIAKEKEMTVDEFLAEYGLEDSEVTKKTTESEMVAKMTVANYAKYSDKAVDELLAEYGIEGADEDMLWTEAQLLTPMSKYAESMGMTFDDLKAQAGFPDEITEKTTLKEAEEIMEKMQEASAEEDTAEKEAE